MSVPAVVILAAVTGSMVGTAAGAGLAAWAWARASGETRRCPEHSHPHFARRNH